MKSPVEILLHVVCIGGRLDIVNGQLRMLLPAICPEELKDAIRQQKAAFLDLMRLSFLIVRSGVLNSIVLFASDDATKQLLVLAGADPGSIYTKAELGALVARRITPNELRLIHSAKQQFNGKVRN